jgi:hypothetical protein
VRRPIGGIVVIALWLVAAAGADIFAYRITHLADKGAARPLDASGQLLQATPAVPPDPGRGPQPLCWDVPHYVPPPGGSCPPAPAGSVRP